MLDGICGWGELSEDYDCLTHSRSCNLKRPGNAPISRACLRLHGAPHLRVVGKIQEPRQDAALCQHGMIQRLQCINVPPWPIQRGRARLEAWSMQRRFRGDGASMLMLPAAVTCQQQLQKLPAFA